MPPRNVVPKPVQKPHPPLWVACSRRDTILLAAEKGLGVAHVRVHRSRGSPPLGRRLRGEDRREVRAGRPDRQHEHGVRHRDDVPRRRGGGAAAGARGRQLLRLLTRPLLRLRRPRARQDQRVGAVRRASRRSRLLARRRRRRRAGAARRQGGAGDTKGLRGATGTPDQIRDYCRASRRRGSTS